MKRLLYLLFIVMIISCSTEDKQLNVVRDLAIQDLKTQLQLPEATKFNNEEIQVDKSASDIEAIESQYIVSFTINSQDDSGNAITKTHKLIYVKIGEGGLSPDDFELVSFD